MISEPDVSLTDFVLGIECAAFVVLLIRTPTKHQALKRWFCFFFGSLGLAAFLGGAFHGFFPDATSTTPSVLWLIILVAVGISALSAWAIGAWLQFQVRLRRIIIAAATTVFAGYCMIVLFFSQEFIVAISYYLPATLFLLVVLCIRYIREQETVVLIGATGLGLTFLASSIQQLKITIHPSYLTHNALYHLVQGIALFLLYRTANWYLSFKSIERREP